MKQGENRLSVSYDGEWIYDIVLESSYGQLLDALAPVLKGLKEKNDQNMYCNRFERGKNIQK